MQALENYLATKAHDAEFMAWKLASENTGSYINRHLFSVRMFKSDSATYRTDFEGRNALLDHALRNATATGLFLQCGVKDAQTINFISRVLPREQVIHGIDSFEAIPAERPLGMVRREICRGDELPRVNENVRLHKGWLDQELPAFLKDNPQPLAFLYIDVEDYTATRTVLGHLKDRFTAGTIIVFEEYFNFPGWEQFGYQAFRECIADSPFQYEYIGFTPRHYSVAVKLFART